MNLPLGILQGRLTPAKGRGIQFFPNGKGEWEKEFFDAKSIGFDIIELLVRPKGLREHPLMTKEGRTRLCELTKETGISVPSVHAYFEKNERYSTDLVDIVTATHEAGAKVILISFFNEKKLSGKSDETWANAHRLMAPAARLAQKYSIALGIETELSAQTLLTFIKEAETPEVFGVYYDLGNQFACGFPVAEEILQLKEKIVGVHIKDRLPQTDPAIESRSVPLGTGNADFKGAFQALRNIGYARPLIIQGARGEDEKEIELYKTYRQYILDIWNQ